MDILERKERARSRKRRLLRLPVYTIGEEIVNAITHGLGAVMAFCAFLALLLSGPKTVLAATSLSIYGVSMFLLYLVSCLYHALAVNRAKKVFQVLDHCTVYLLIAGTYTPISLLSIGGAPGIFLTAFVWGVSILAIVLNAVDMRRFRVFSMICYIALGWCVIFFLRPLVQSVDTRSLVFLVAGGVLYTVGAILYGLGRTHKYMHSVWHVFCLGGSIFHFLVVWQICLQYSA